MTVRLKLLPVFAAATLAVSPASAASAERSPTNSASPKPPAAMPAQLMPAGIYPLTPEREQALRPKDSFKECDACPEMVVVPKGSFTMGTPAGEPERDSGEGPQHRVTIAAPFAVGRFAITGDEWNACVAEHACDPAFARPVGPGE